MPVKRFGEKQLNTMEKTEGMAYARIDNGAEWYMMKATQGRSNSTTAGLSRK